MKKFAWEMIDRERNPFLVPEGYFESLTGRVMGRLPEAASAIVPFRKRNRLLYWLSACSVAAAISISFLLAGMENGWNARSSYAGETKFSQAGVSGDEDIYDYLLLDEENVYDYATAEGK